MVRSSPAVEIASYTLQALPHLWVPQRAQRRLGDLRRRDRIVVLPPQGSPSADLSPGPKAPCGGAGDPARELTRAPSRRARRRAAPSSRSSIRSPVNTRQSAAPAWPAVTSVSGGAALATVASGSGASGTIGTYGPHLWTYASGKGGVRANTVAIDGRTIICVQRSQRRP